MFPRLKLTLITLIITASCSIAITDSFKHSSLEGIFPNREYYRAMFVQSPIPQGMVAETGEWLHVNSALCNLVGYTETELLTKTFQEITHPDDLVTDVEMTKKVINGKITLYTMKKRYIGKWNTIVHVTLHVQGIYNENGKFSHFYSIVVPREPYDENLNSTPKTQDTPISVVKFFRNEWRILIPWAIIIYVFVVKFGIEWRTIVTKMKQGEKSKED